MFEIRFYKRFACLPRSKSKRFIKYVNRFVSISTKCQHVQIWLEHAKWRPNIGCFLIRTKLIMCFFMLYYVMDVWIELCSLIYCSFFWDLFFLFWYVFVFQFCTFFWKSYFASLVNGSRPTPNDGDYTITKRWITTVQACATLNVFIIGLAFQTSGFWNLNRIFGEDSNFQISDGPLNHPQT